MNHASLFSGIGGFDLAAEWMGWNNLFHCEWNEFGQKVLKYYWPESELFTDITKSNFKKYANRIDVLTGGFPCQPYSQAGKRKGKDDDRHLWPEMLRAIREIQPPYVVGENVRGLTNWNGGMVFDEVQSDLEAEGYEVAPFLLPACAVNAPHRRDRIWFIAYSNTNSIRLNGRKCKHEINASEGREYAQHDIEQMGDVTNTESERFQGCRELGNIIQSSRKGGPKCINESNSKQDSSNPNIIGQPNRHEQSNSTEQGFDNRGNIKGGIIADTNGIGFGLQEYRNGKSEFFNKDGEINNWQNFPTESPVCGRNDGFSGELDGITLSKWKKESLKAYGNAIVPQVALQIFKSIQEYESKHQTS